MKRGTVMVTGGAGYVGSHACKALASAGFLPVTIDNMINGHDWSVKWGPLVRADLSDSTALDTAFASYQPLAVLHFAAFAYVGESVREPGKYYRNNVAGTLNLLDAMLRHRCRHIVFSSSCATYGDPTVIPISEDHLQQPINPYGRSKLMVERILRDYEHAHGIRYCALRYFNAAGADPDGEIGEDHTPETHLIPLVIDAALGRRPHVELFGTDYPTADGTAVRDYIHVSDLAEVHVRALGHLLTDRASICLNVGTGSGQSVREVVEAVQRLTRSVVPTRNAPRRPGDPPILVADPARAAAVLGWQPRISNLETIVATAARWHAGREERSRGASPQPAPNQGPRPVA